MPCQSSMISKLQLSFRGQAIQINSDDRGLLIWLAEFLSPSFSASRQLDYPYNINVIISDAHYQKLQQALPSTVRLIDTFLLDSSVIQLPGWHTDNNEMIVFDQANRAFSRVSADKSNIEIISPERNPTLRLHLMRVVRELALNNSLQQGDLFLHAAAVQWQHRGIIITGEKAAGKTTTLIYLLQQGAQYLANDRVCVSFNPQAVMQGMPTIVAIRPGTLDYCPQFGERLLASAYRPLITIAEAANEQPELPRAMRTGKYGLNPAQLCALLGVRSLPDSLPQLLLFPRIDKQIDRFQFVKLTGEVAATRLQASLFGINCWHKQAELFLNIPELPQPDPAMINRLTAEIACYELRLGAQAFVDGQLALALQEIKD